MDHSTIFWGHTVRYDNSFSTGSSKRCRCRPHNPVERHPVQARPSRLHHAQCSGRPYGGRETPDQQHQCRRHFLHRGHGRRVHYHSWCIDEKGPVLETLGHRIRRSVERFHPRPDLDGPCRKGTNRRLSGDALPELHSCKDPSSPQRRIPGRQARSHHKSARSSRHG